MNFSFNKIRIVIFFFTIAAFAATAASNEYEGGAENSTENATKESSLLHGKTLPVFLYFADARYEFLTARQEYLPYPENPTSLCRALLLELIKGPKDECIETLPAGTELRALYVANDKTAYVDLGGQIRTGHPQGIRSEAMTIYSIVNTLVLNSPEVEQVKILIDGAESETLAGHMDIRFPFKADILFVK